MTIKDILTGALGFGNESGPARPDLHQYLHEPRQLIDGWVEILPGTILLANSPIKNGTYRTAVVVNPAKDGYFYITNIDFRLGNIPWQGSGTGYPDGYAGIIGYMPPEELMIVMKATHRRKDPNIPDDVLETIIGRYADPMRPDPETGIIPSQTVYLQNEDPEFFQIIADQL